MATITEDERRFAKGVFKYYTDQYNGQEILGMINKMRGDVSKHINIGRISKVKNDNTIIPMEQDEVDRWIKLAQQKK